MLKIRAEQMESFKAVANAAFERRLVEHLRQHHADVVVKLPTGASTVEQMPDEILREIVRNGIARARGYDISWESTLSAFVVLMFVGAPNFDEHPLIQRILRDDQTPPNSRIDQLWERTSEQNWEAVEQHYDANAWALEPQRDGK